jgi:predicted aldo/keto reductase-like oxidoreductase
MSDETSNTREPHTSNPQSQITRRNFVGLAVGATVVAGFSTGTQGLPSAGMQYRTLGHTGEKVSIVGIGGYHLGAPDEDEAIRIVRTALDNGVNFLDNCWDYNNGVSEIRMGKALRDGYRKKAFLMTKVDGRTKQAAAQQIDESLKRLQTDVIDLLQFHEIIRMEDPDRLWAAGGGMEAAFDAKKSGKIRYIGFTGHKSPEIHLKMLHTCLAHNFTPDSVQMPLNVMDAHFDSFQAKVLPELVKHNIGVLGMKPLGDKQIINSHTVSPVQGLHYAMNLPTSVVITGCDSMKILEQALDAARTFKPLSRQEVTAMLAKTAEVAKNGQFELYKTSHNFDGTYHNPQWLG